MADNVVVSAGTGTTVAADEVVDGTLGTVKVQYVKLMDGTLDGTGKALIDTKGLSTQHISGSIASGAVASGAVASGAVASGAIASGAVASGAFASGALAAGAIAAGATSLVKLEDVASADGDAGVPSMAIRKATPANTSGTDGDYEMLQMSAGRLWTNSLLGDGTNAVAVKAASSGAAAVTDPALVVTLRDTNANGQATMTNSAPVTLATNQAYQTGMSPRSFVAAFTTLTRPANTTAYTAADSISNNATAGSVTALSASLSDTNDDPITITDILVTSTDTGLAGKKIRAYLYNSDPTASSGVGGGDNAAFSQKVAGYIGSFMGYMETGFSDGTVGRLVPTFNETNFTQAGGFVVAKPTSGAKTLYIQYQAVEAFTPSASSTTIIGTARGFQGRAS